MKHKFKSFLIILVIVFIVCSMMVTTFMSMFYR